MASKKQSPAVQLLQLVWDQQGYQMDYSWERLNSAMSTALSLAVWSGLRFDLHDFTAIAARFRMGYWGGNDRHMLGERFYAAACAGQQRYSGCRSHGENRSAALSFEKWKDRKPFIVQVDPRRPTRGRVAVGSQFYWHNNGRAVWVTCTSFAEDGQSLTACTYTNRDVNLRSKVALRKNITHDKIADYHKRLREAARPAADTKGVT